MTGDQLLVINNHRIAGLEHTTHLIHSAPDPVLLRLVQRLASLRNAATYDVVPVERHCKQRLSLTRDLHEPVPVELVMGANVSRHSGKGLSGRRTQSSGNLCGSDSNGSSKSSVPSVAKFLGPCAGAVGDKDRNKFCGSLPNHLDGPDDGDGEDATCYAGNNNNHVDRVEYVTVPPGKKHTIHPALLKNNTFKSDRPREPMELQLKLQPLWRGSDAGCDQGYGSERSPEEEFLPSLPGDESDVDPHEKYPFITPDCTFAVTVMKGPRGLGLSVTGGCDTSGHLPGLIRIKRLFPHQPAWSTGQLVPGDLLLAANGVTLTGLSNYEALEVLRTTPSTVVLTVCRPPGEDFARLTPPSEPPPPPRRGYAIAPAPPVPPLAPILPDGPFGEFDIIMCKVNGSLGFTLRKEDQSVLGHYVRALVREPALSDGRIQSGDKIMAVNDVAMSPLSHEEAVMFLRQCGDHVKLRLYRDSAQTPVSAMSPTESDLSRPKLHLRQEAMDMLCDLAVRKLSPGESMGSSSRTCRSPSASPRRLRRLTRSSTPDVDCVQFGDVGPNQAYYITCQTTSDSDTSVNSQPGTVSQSSTFSYRSAGPHVVNHSSNVNDSEQEVKPVRPNFLDLCAQAAGTPVATRKPRFQFTVAANSYELNNLDNDVLDAPTIYTLSSNSDSRFHATSSDDYTTDLECVSLPHEPVSTSTCSTGFSYKNPAYQTAHPQCSKDATDVCEPTTGQSNSEQPETHTQTNGEEGTKSLLKWKGIVFTPEADESPDVTDGAINPTGQSKGDQVISVELNRGWNSRLGFSLQTDPKSKKTIISAIYADSVAAKDGRLRTGDQVLMVNDEAVDKMSTADVIDLLRIVRGSICITVLRKMC